MSPSLRRWCSHIFLAIIVTKNMRVEAIVVAPVQIRTGVRRGCSDKRWTNVRVIVAEAARQAMTKETRATFLCVHAF